MANSFIITIRPDEVKGLASALGGITNERMTRATVLAVNQVAERTYTTAKKKMLSGINLPESYLDEKFILTPAPEGRPIALITARRRHTSLARYSPKQMMQPAKHPAKSKGDARLGIPSGMKSAGVRVEVTRGSAKPISYAFFMPMKAGRGEPGTNGMGLFERIGPNKKDYKTLYGPSVYQLFRTAVGGIYDDIETDLRATVVAATRAEIEKALA